MKLKNFFENLIMIAIILVIAHTLMAEIATYQQWSIKVRNVLIYIGLGFDLLFSIEFLTRSIFSGKGKRLFRYWFYERGWVDFLSSLPLLILDSGPSVFFLLFGAHMGPTTDVAALNVLKIVKAIRITRILRLVRIIKIFGKIHNTNSKMAQHHTISISTTAVFTIIITIFSYAFFENKLHHAELHGRQVLYSGMIKQVIDSQMKKTTKVNQLLQRLFVGNNTVLAVRYKDMVVLENVPQERIESHYFLGAKFDNLDGDYSILTVGDYKVFISKMDLNRRVAFEHIKSFLIIIMLILAFMFLYTRHFAQTISDVVHILNKGFRKKNYNLQIKIKEQYGDSEINQLAKYYNESFLPAKFRQIEKEKQKQSGNQININDLTNFKMK